MGSKAAETTHNVNTSGPGTVTDAQCSGEPRSYAKATRASTMRRAAAGHWKLTTTN